MLPYHVFIQLDSFHSGSRYNMVPDLSQPCLMLWTLSSLGF